MSVHDEGIERIIAWLRTQEAEEVKPAITALRELQTLRRNSDKYDLLLSEVKAAMEEMRSYRKVFKPLLGISTEAVGADKAYEECLAILRKHIKEVGE
jgi:adenine-specific DNA methylase